MFFQTHSHLQLLNDACVARHGDDEPTAICIHRSFIDRRRPSLHFPRRQRRCCCAAPATQADYPLESHQVCPMYIYESGRQAPKQCTPSTLSVISRAEAARRSTKPSPQTVYPCHCHRFAQAEFDSRSAVALREDAE